MEGHNKLLAIVEGKPMIRRVVEAGLSSKVDETIVVLGWEEHKLREVLTDLPCRLVVNSEFEKGQSSSLKAGLMEVHSATRAMLVLPGDIAKIDSLSINKVVDSYMLNAGTIVVAAHNGKHGHPILLDRSLFGEIVQITEETYGLKAVVRKYEHEVRLVEVGTDNILRDVDTPDDLRRLTFL